MDPFWAAAAEFWWVAPVVAGGAVVSVAGVRRRLSSGGRRLGYDAARLDLQNALRQANEARVAVRVARAELAGLLAGRAAGATDPAAVSDARRRAREAEQGSRAAAAAVRARRARLEAARAELALGADPQRRPLPRTIAAHEAVLARWMAYETDPGLLLAYPAMGDARDPSTSAFLTAMAQARDARPAPTARITPAEFGAYRDAVEQLRRAFDTAEEDARARAAGRDPVRERERAARSGAWQDAAQQAIALSADALDRATDAAASWVAAWNARDRGPKRRG
ncbi:hypothetical protein [Microbacterium azadirachtae]|uniref:hypothetical protein n=1 Tax=Microbacterium azadirachtae TaxID=582680 RepID=UPI000887301C|nr:hypothetical protein [Microbacterium azadirachtae]SDM37309.1 hypothetical protein SAMN04488593_3379 [Microbacterium azadirachtae]SEG53568.1 hypothetical protein SAMN04488594_3364 [Microbacterium azadirachtae]SEG56448.1 hypothetical protein SAMN04488592_3374 [Microbacterium azadirachtae]